MAWVPPVAKCEVVDVPQDIWNYRVVAEDKIPATNEDRGGVVGGFVEDGSED